MKNITLIITSVFLLIFSNISFSEEILDSYIAKLSKADHYSSRGKRLKSVAAIIRQDRANYHKYGKRDRKDENDNYFSNKRNRNKLEKLLSPGLMSASTTRKILKGTPIILVEIYENKVAVYIKK